MDLERQRYAKDIESYWREVIQQCEIVILLLGNILSDAICHSEGIK